MDRYPDGRWWVVDHRPSPSFPIWCRGNAGEVYPNVVTPLTGSIVREPFGAGQAAVARRLGFASRKQLAEFAGQTSMASCFAGYLYANVSLARSAVARTPGLTVEMVDAEMFGLSGAPPHRRGPGERNPLLALRSIAGLGRGLVRPNQRRLAGDRAFVAAHSPGTASAVASGSDEALIATVESVRPHLARFMDHLLTASALAGVGRSTVSRLLAERADDGTVNRLTSGLGTVESSEPAHDLWALGRLVAGDPDLTSAFDAGLDYALERVSGDGAFARAFAAFQSRHGARGPDEWELASPTWGTDPTIGLVMIDRLRHAPDHNDPVAAGTRMAREREALTAEVRAGLARRKRPAFDAALRAVRHYGPQREATKAAFIRLLYPTRLALAELARRSAWAHGDFFLLMLEELPRALTDPGQFTSIVDERRQRRDELQSRVPPFWFDGEIPDPATWARRGLPAAMHAGTRELTGLGVCAGIATGRARIVTDPTEPGDLGPGDILVAPITDPAWTPLFLAAAGVVVDVGAQQSHAAIVARELGIPAVVSATGASTTIPHGALVTVDGSSGRVTVW
jgi:pyruvate,water dikinase